MKLLLTNILTFIITAILCFIMFSEQSSYEESKHNKIIETWRDSLAKCNGITARINKDSTYYIKNH